MQIVVRASIMFLFLWAALRVMGRKELAEMSAFELVLLVVMCDLIQQCVTQQDSSVSAAILAVSTIIVRILSLSYASFRSKKVQSIFEGQPVVLVQDGKVLQKMLEYERLTLDELKDAAREQGIADVREVRLGVIEADGKFSFVRFDAERPQQPHEIEA
jgi:uncharacterized membrane protein YcaP (DUF421 family)